MVNIMFVRSRMKKQCLVNQFDSFRQFWTWTKNLSKKPNMVNLKLTLNHIMTRGSNVAVRIVTFLSSVLKLMKFVQYLGKVQVKEYKFEFQKK